MDNTELIKEARREAKEVNETGWNAPNIIKAIDALEQAEKDIETLKAQIIAGAKSGPFTVIGRESNRPVAGEEKDPDHTDPPGCRHLPDDSSREAEKE